MADRTFDWYRTLVELGNFEVEHGRIRFYENSKLHMAFAAGSLGLASYAVSSGAHVVLILAALVSVLALLHGAGWLKQIVASAWWERRWRGTAATLEGTPDFRAAVGAAELRAWSHEEVERAIKAREWRPGTSTRLYQLSIWSWVVFHGLVTILILVYGVIKFCRSTSAPGV